MKKNTKKGKKLAVKLTVRLAIVLFVVFLSMTVNIVVTNRADLTQRELNKLELLAKGNATVAKEFMESAIDKQEVLEAAVHTLTGSPEEIRASALRDIIDQVMNNANGILSYYFVSEPNAYLPNTPSGLTIFSSAEGTILEYAMFSNVNESAYQTARQAEGITIIDPFEKVISGKTYQVVAVLQPVRNAQNQVIGVLGCNIDTAVLSGAAYQTGGYTTFANQIICGHETVIINSRDSSTVGLKYVDVSTSRDPQRILSAAESGDSLLLLDPNKDGSANYRAYVPFYVGSSSVPWLSGSSIDQSEFENTIIRQSLMLIVIALAGLILLAAITYFSVRKALKPLGSLEQAAQGMARGDLSVHIDCTTDDELGRVSESYNEAIATIRSYVADIDRSMGEMAVGNFDIYPTQTFVGDFSGIERSISLFIQTMCRALRKIGEASDVVSDGAGQIANSATILSQGSSEQAASVEELTASIHTLSTQVAGNDTNAQTAGQRVKEAGEQLENSSGHMNDMISAMHEITESSAQIGKIIKTIEDIAFQTNILALNAAVEAARAGPAGRGFAVVADEVRNLAGKSAEAAKNTTELIQKSTDSVEAGAKIAAEAASSLEAVVEKANAVVGIVSEIQTSSHHQKEEIGILSTNAGQISQVIQDNTASAEESSASAEELASQASLLKSLVQKFKLNQKLI